MDCRALAAGALLLLCLPMRGDDTLSRIIVSGETSGSARRLAAADKLVADAQWAEAVEEYQRILEEAGDELVPLDPRLSVQARRLCHVRLAALPPAALKLYREKVDTQAEKWLKQWETERDAMLLRRIVDEAFCSRAAERALDLLGDLACERGDFDEAQRWWQMLAAPASAKPAEKNARGERLVFPDPQRDLARIRAKQILASIYQGDRGDIVAEVKAFREIHGKAEGALAGRNGLYADILKELSELPPARNEDGDWPTFAGALSRQRILEQPPGRALLDEPTWTGRLGAAAAKAPAKVPTMAELARSLAFHPVIVGEQALVADSRSITAFDLRTGQRTLWYDLVRDGKKEMPDVTLPAMRDLSCTLTVADDLVFARLGAQGLPPAAVVVEGKGKKKVSHNGFRDTFLVCLNRLPDGTARQRWLHKANESAAGTEMFEGTPVVRDGAAYVAVTSFQGAPLTSVGCYDAVSGRPRWRKPVEVCRVQDFRPIGPRYRHHLLTVAGAKVVYCSHSGAVVALDADSGRRAWAIRYPSRGERTEDRRPSPRDLAPCLYAAGRLFAAPADYDRILCLDPETGRLLWESAPPAEVVHLLGVAHGKLIFTTTGDIRAVDLATGQTSRDWLQPDDGSPLAPFGRGLLAGSWVFWPTVDGLRVLDQETGQPVVRVPYNFTSNRLRGNLVAAAGCLLVADTETLHAYVSPRLLLEQRRKESRAQPQSAAKRHALAQAEADAALHEQALASFAQVERDAGASERWQRLAHARRHELLLELAESAGKAKQWEQAAGYLDRAAAVDFSVSERLRALALQATLWSRAQQPARAVAFWQAILEDDRLRAARVDDTQLAGTYAEERISRLLKLHGAGVYQAVEEAAKKLLASAKGEQAVERLEHLARTFPNAAVTPSALLELAQHYEKMGQAGAAARSYRRAVPRARTDSDHAAALAGLARACERQHCWEASRDLWQQLGRQFGGRTLAVVDAQRPVSAVVQQQLRQPGYQRLQESSQSELALPLLRSWNVSEPGRLLAADDGAAGDCLFFAHAENQGKVVLSCRDANGGKERWARTLMYTPSWIGRCADLAVAAGSDGITCLSVADGVPLWSISPSPSTRSVTPAMESLGPFQVKGGRLFFFEGRRRLLALDVVSGRLLWSQSAPGAALGLAAPAGRFQPLFQVNEAWLVTQTSGGRLCVFDAVSGQKRSQLKTASDPWPRSPVVVDRSRLLIVADHQQLVLLDAVQGKAIWRRELPKPSVSGAAPAVLAVVRREGAAQGVLLMIDGWQLEYVDLDTSQPRWRVGNPLWLAPSASEGSCETSVASDDDALYFAARNILYACSLNDGRPLWTRALPGPPASWQVMRARGHVVVYPLAWASTPPLPRGALPKTSRPQDFPILLCDPKDGQLVQCLNFPCNGAAGQAQLLTKGLVALSGGAAWGLNAD